MKHFILVFILTIATILISPLKADAAVLPPLEEDAAANCVFIGMPVEFDKVSKSEIIKDINALRYEAYEEGLINNYVPVKWSPSLEKVAQIRACEMASYNNKTTHNRPNGKTQWVLIDNGLKSRSESVAWTSWRTHANYTINTMWHAEKKYFTGDLSALHYGAIINPYHTHVGMAVVYSAGGTYIVAELNHFGLSPENQLNNYGNQTQVVELPKIGVSVSLTGAGTIASGSTSSYSFNTKYNGLKMVPLRVIWKTSNSKIASIYNGKVTGIAPGKATITGQLAYKQTVYPITASKTITVNPKKTSLTKVTGGSKYFKAYWSRQTKNSPSYQIEYSKSSTFAKGNKKINITKNSVLGKKITKLPKGKYYVRIRTYKKVSDITYYSSWSSKKVVTVK